jgi:hypothetical protein
MSPVILHFFEVIQAASVGEGIEVYHFIGRIFLKDILNEVGADEASAASYKQFHSFAFSFL